MTASNPLPREHLRERGRAREGAGEEAAPLRERDGAGEGAVGVHALASAIYTGRVRHRRYAPRLHAFTSRLFLMYLDLDELPTLFTARWLWRYERRGFAAFNRADYLGDPAVPLADAVRALVADRTGRRPNGPIRLLTHLRYLGYCFNPVSVYYCFDRDGRDLEAIVAEVTNTPWNERYAYVLDAARGSGDAATRRFRFAKAFHVSPFMGMDCTYDWRFTVPGTRLVVHMENHTPAGKLFEAAMTLRRREISAAALARTLLEYPLMTARVTAAIYLQAARLWIKRTPFFSHP